MKKTLFVALLACFTMMFASCNKEKTLNGTSWKSTVTTTDQVTEDVVGTMRMKIDFTMKFTNATQGVLSASSTVTLTTPDGNTGPMPGYNQESRTANFTYTFDGKNGTIKHDDGPKSFTFSYDKKNNTITIKNILDSDEGMGSGSQINIDAVFTEVK